ncbi:MAG: hypothetical protein JW760_10660 [Spirochaetales bacterium]|nr:hypothetical protein [Spirochaetales bacterium]
MYAFLFKKSFFDLWDNLWFIIFLNLALVLSLLIPLAVFALLPSGGSGALKILLLLISVVCFFSGLGASAELSRAMTDYKHPSFSSLPGALRSSFPSSLAFAAFWGVYLFILRYVFLFYQSVTSPWGAVGLMVLLWVTLFLLLISLFYFPVMARLERKTGKIIKKSLLLFLDNPGFSFVLLSGVVILGAVSVLTAFLFPGPGGMLIWLSTGLKLRLYKYEYRDNPEYGKEEPIPWERLFQEEKELLGKRTFKGLVFPWKD